MTVLATGIEFTRIPILEPGEQLVVHVDVGNMPPSMTQKYVAQIKESFETGGHMIDGVQYIFAPMRDGRRAIELEIIKGKEDNRGNII